jgi:hypothetical protein
MRNAWQKGLFACALSALTAVPVAAQTPRPYQQVPVTYDRTAAADPALTGLVAKLKESVGNSNLDPVFAALSTNVAVISCPADPLAACAPGKRGVRQTPQSLPPAERLRQGLCCGDMPKAEITEAIRIETVTGQLAAALEADSIGAHPDVQGLACLPAWPIFDRTKATAAVRAAGIERENLRVTTEEIILRTKPDEGAPEAVRLPAGQIAPFMTDLAENVPDGWYAIALPKGGLGYSDQVGLNELAPSGLCFAREGDAWKIALFVMRG